MIAFRGAHPSIARSTYWRDDVTWFGTDGPPDLSARSHSIAYVLRGGSERDDDLYVMINAWTESLEFTIQDGTAGEWRCVIDTGRDAPDDIDEDLQGEVLDHRICRVGARSVVVLVRPAA
jgi:glycogen operon protein